MKVSDMFAAWSDHRPVCRGEGALGEGGWPETRMGREEGAQLLVPEGTGLRPDWLISLLLCSRPWVLHSLTNLKLHLVSTFSVSRPVLGSEVGMRDMASALRGPYNQVGEAHMKQVANLWHKYISTTPHMEGKSPCVTLP